MKICSFITENEIDIAILPSVNANDNLIDEDSGDEDEVSVNNLPASQLLALAEIENVSDGNRLTDDPQISDDEWDLI